MPIYEYRCQQCGVDKEALQKMSDPPLETCDECGGRLKKRLSAPAFQFKGSGWYVTDYARKDKGGSATESGGSSTGDSGSSSSGDGGSASETGTAAKPEKKGSASGESSD